MFAAERKDGGERESTLERRGKLLSMVFKVYNLDSIDTH